MVGVSASPRRPAGKDRAYNRPALIALVLVAAVICLALGWWQWERFESASGTGQNLGYALQWPLFAAFVVFAYFRFVRLESESAEGPAPAEPAATRRPRKDRPREIPAGILPERPTAARAADPVLAEYNRYLAELHAADVEEQVRAARLDLGKTERSAG
ncbi:transcriptional regulator [Nocardia farcinica]|uniref:transcriptional regulator n=1 Tax=Nocardia farcinica TaxID=37329 RepID=UPI002455C3CB|nr:transcriptional regulator [Nocardia farcinica]